MKELLTIMFNGWIIRETSWNAATESYEKDETTAMIEAAGGDTLKGTLISIFDYWGNDIQSLAAHYGIGLDRTPEGKLFIIEVPPAPSPLHWWHEGKWNEPLRDEEAEVVKP